jgi:hypothetical protein
MGVARMLRPWRARLQAGLGHLHGHQLNGLAVASFAMVHSQNSQLSRLAWMTPGEARVPSSERRWQRLVANKRLDVQGAAEAWAKANLPQVGEITLCIDETPKANDLRAMKVSWIVRGRSLPLLWRCYRPDALPMPQNELVLDLLERTAGILPTSVHPTLLADRGLSWPQVVDSCTTHGWSFILRLQGQTCVQFDDGRVRPIAALAPQRGACWQGSARVFKKAGWRRTNVVAWWPEDSDEPWLLISDHPPKRALCRWYRRRMRQEQSFRDEKSHGFRWNESRVRKPAHAERLLLIMALAMTWLISIGLRLIRAGQRSELERPDRRTLSVFQLALRHLQRCLLEGRPPPICKSVGRWALKGEGNRFRRAT